MSLQESSEKMAQLKRDQLAYQTARTRFLEFLQLVYEKLRSCSDATGDPAALEHKIATIKVRRFRSSQVNDKLDWGFKGVLLSW